MVTSHIYITSMSYVNIMFASYVDIIIVMSNIVMIGSNDTSFEIMISYTAHIFYYIAYAVFGYHDLYMISEIMNFI